MEEKKLTQTEREEYQAMKLNYQSLKEGELYYRGLSEKLVRTILKIIPNKMLIEELKSMKLIKRNWEMK